MRTTRDFDVTIIELAGEIDLYSSTRVNLEFELVLSQQPLPHAIQLDLMNVDFIDSIGLAVLLTAKQRAESAGCRLRVTSFSPTLARLFDLSRVTNLLTGHGE